jgi:hypothetical protein
MHVTEAARLAAFWIVATGVVGAAFLVVLVLIGAARIASRGA